MGAVATKNWDPAYKSKITNLIATQSFTDYWDQERQKSIYIRAPWWISDGYMLMMEDEALRQSYIDKFHNGDESSFISEYNTLSADPNFIAESESRWNNWDLTSDAFKDYYTTYVEKSQSETAGQIFGGDVTLDSDMSYEEKMAKRSELLKSVLGSEMANIGGAKEDIVTLADFAEYNPLTPQEKELEQEGGKLTPLKDRKQELEKLATGQTKEDTGVVTRQMLQQLAKGPISGIKTATGTSDGASNMQSTFNKLAEKASAQNAIQQRVSQYIDKQEATLNLSKLISGELGYDIKRENELKSSRAKAAVGLAGAQLTAQEHAAQLAKGAKL